MNAMLKIRHFLAAAMQPSVDRAVDRGKLSHRVAVDHPSLGYGLDLARIS